MLLLVEGVRAQNLLENGSFEQPDVDPATAEVFTSIPGWTDSTPCGIEVQDHCCGSPSDGAQHVELDSNCSSSISQTVATQPGAKYVLSFDFSPRPGVISNDLIVAWEGGQVFDLSAGGFGLEDTEWTHHSAVVTATGTAATLEFTDPSFGDEVGTYIDNLPEPGGSIPLCGGSVVVAGLARLRRRSVTHQAARRCWCSAKTFLQAGRDSQRAR